MSSSERVVRPLALPELSRHEARRAAVPVLGSASDAVREGHRIASAIVARANEQAQTIAAAAREQGAEQGLRLAREREGQSLRDAAAALADAAARLDAAREDLAGELRAALPDLAVAVAERLLRHELAVRPEALVLLIRDAIGAVTPAGRVTIRLHPEDLATLERHRDLLAGVLGGAEVRVETTPEVGRGGCRIDTESLTLGAGVPQQIERALALLTEPSAERPAERSEERPA